MPLAFPALLSAGRPKSKKRFVDGRSSRWRRSAALASGQKTVCFGRQIDVGPAFIHLPFLRTGMSHSRILPPSPAATPRGPPPETSRVPSRLKATHPTSRSFPWRMAFSFRADTSQRMTAPPRPPEINVPSGLNATQRTLPRCPWRVACSFPVAPLVGQRTAPNQDGGGRRLQGLVRRPPGDNPTGLADFAESRS